MNRVLIDTHCHLDAPEFEYDRHEVLERGRAAGVRWFVTVGAGRGKESAPDAVALAHTHPDVVACVGIHPQDSCCATEAVLGAIALLARSRCCARRARGMWAASSIPLLATRALRARWWTWASIYPCLGFPCLRHGANIRSTVRLIPLDRLLIETGAPSHAPPPHGGTRNEPAYLSLIAPFYAELMGVALEDPCARSSENASRRFGLSGMS